MAAKVKSITTNYINMTHITFHFRMGKSQRCTPRNSELNGQK